MLKVCPRDIFVRVCNWVADNLDSITHIKPAVFLVREILFQVEVSMGSDASWSLIIEKLIRSALENDKVRNI